MKVAIKNIGLLLVVCLLAILPTVGIAAGAVENKEAEPDKGPNNGLMLREGNFVVELAIFETGVPPEYRAWITDDGKAVDPEVVELEVVLTRLGGVRDEIGFTVQESFLRGDMEIYEPHSFKVTVTAQYQGRTTNGSMTVLKAAQPSIKKSLTPWVLSRRSLVPLSCMRLFLPTES